MRIRFSLETALRKYNHSKCLANLIEAGAVRVKELGITHLIDTNEYQIDRPTEKAKVLSARADIAETDRGAATLKGVTKKIALVVLAHPTKSLTRNTLK
jgi:hypothetical protein